MRSVSAEEMKKIDREAVDVFGIPEIVLMENAGRGAADAIEDVFGIPESVCVVCGKGNNGGDGFVAARHLLLRGSKVKVLLIGSINDLGPSSRTNADILIKLGVEMTGINGPEDQNKILDSLKGSTLIIDAIFGTGLSAGVSGIYSEAIRSINERAGNCRIVSLDIPSGINADTGAVMGIGVTADMTVTFHLAKRGLLLSPGTERCGKIIVKDIGLPYPKEANTGETPELLDKEFVRSRLRLRKMDSNKGSSGRVLVIAGSDAMGGAALLTCRAAFRAGAGMVYLLSESGAAFMINSALPECIVIDGLGQGFERYDSIVFGPGLGTDKHQLLADVMRMAPPRPLIIDADGLNMLSKHKDLLKASKHDIVITPHAGEMSRLTGLTFENIGADRQAAAAGFAAENRVTVLLKGLNTVIASAEGKQFINPSGNPGMATAGSGDALSGIIGAFMAAGLGAADSALCGAFVHGSAGDAAALEKGLSGLIASDIIELIPKSINAIMGVK